MDFIPITVSHPDVAADWDYEANAPLRPEEVSRGMVKVVYWKCPAGHSYDARIDHRCSMKSGCRYCAHKDAYPGETDLATLYPEIAEEWDYENNDKLPSEYLPQSNKWAYWICPICRNSYKKRIFDRTLNHYGCPDCKKEFHTSFQEQAFLFYLQKVIRVENRVKIDKREIDLYLPDRRIGIEYNGAFYHKGKAEKDKQKHEKLRASGVRLIVISEGDERSVSEDQITIKIRNMGSPSSEELQWGIRELFKMLGLEAPPIDVAADHPQIYTQYINSEKENSLEVKFPEIAKEWHPTKNLGLKPSMVSFGSQKKVCWLCPTCGGDYDMTVANRTSSKPQGCPYCSGRKVLVGFNDLATKYPDIAAQWHPTKNGVKKPQDYTSGSNEKVYWLCSECGYDWPAIIYSRCGSKTCGCPCCAGKVVVPGVNDLATKNPLVAAEWHPTKNGDLTPRSVTSGSQKKVWWLCSKCGNEWKAVISSRNSGCGCEKCGRENAGKTRRKTAVKQKGSLVETKPLLAAQWHPTKNGDKTPEEYTAGSNFDAWWLCPVCGHEWQAPIFSRSRGNGCDICGRKKGWMTRKAKKD